MSRVLDLLTGTWKEDAPKKKRSPEAEVGRQVDAYLERIGGYVRQINSGGTLRNGKWTTSGQGSGISDRLCWLPFGRMIAVELKAPGKKKTASESQIRFLEQLISRGFHACIADSVECVKICLGQTKEEQLATLTALKPVKRVVDPSTLDPLFP